MINQFMNWLTGLFRQLACWWTCHKVSTALTMTVRALIPALLLAPTDLSIVCAVRSAINTHITVVLFFSIEQCSLEKLNQNNSPDKSNGYYACNNEVYMRCGLIVLCQENRVGFVLCFVLIFRLV